MNIIDTIKLTTDLIEPLSKQGYRREALRNLPQITTVIKALADQHERIRSQLRLLAEVYEIVVPTDVERARAAAARPLGMVARLDDFLRNGDQVSFSNLLQEARRAADDAIRTIEKTLHDHRQRVRQELNASRMMMRLPDLFDSPDHQAEMQQAVDKVAEIIQQEEAEFARNPGGLAQRWREYYAILQRLREKSSFEQLQQIHNLSHQTIELIRSLLDGQMIPIAEISPQTLEELLRLEHLRGQITLQIHAR